MRWALLAAVFASQAFGQTVTMPKEVTAPVGRLAVVVVQSDGADTKYFADDGLDVFREYDPDPKVIRLRVIGYEAGKYSLRAITCRDNKLSEAAETVVVIGGAKPPPTPIDPPPTKPDPTNPPPAAQFYFVVVRPDGPVTPELAAALRSPAWDEVRKAGHLVKDFPADELPAGIDRPASLPALVTLTANADGKTWTPQPGTRPVPITDAQIRGLLK